MTIAVYPGSFDPITNGHIDLVRKASKIFKRVIIGVGMNSAKKGIFDPIERLDLMLSEHFPSNVASFVYKGLTLDFCRKHNATVILRGLRAGSDFDSEFTMSMTNQKLNSEIQTVFLTPSPEHQFTSSSTVRELARFRRPLDELKKFVPDNVARALIEKYHGL